MKIFSIVFLCALFSANSYANQKEFLGINIGGSADIAKQILIDSGSVVLSDSEDMIILSKNNRFKNASGTMISVHKGKVKSLGVMFVKERSELEEIKKIIKNKMILKYGKDLSNLNNITYVTSGLTISISSIVEGKLLFVASDNDLLNDELNSETEKREALMGDL